MRDDILERLRALRSTTRGTIESLTILRWRMEEIEAQLESPQAVFEYFDAFIDLFGREAERLDRLAADVEAEPLPSFAARLRQLELPRAADEQRCREFNDRWVQKPLPYDAARPLLARMVRDVREQLARFREVDEIAALIESQADRSGDHERYDRRALFSRFTDPLRRRRSG